MGSRRICLATTGRRALTPTPTWFVMRSGCNDDVVLVGHSRAGMTIPLVAARRPVRQLVYLCGVIPDIGRSMFDQLRDEPMLNPAYVKGLTEPDMQTRTTWVDLKLARQLLFADCDESTSEAAVNRLGPQARYPYSAPFSLAEFPPVCCTYVVCSDDQFVNPEWSRRIARDRLGADPMSFPGVIHRCFHDRQRWLTCCSTWPRRSAEPVRRPKGNGGSKVYAALWVRRRGSVGPDTGGRLSRNTGHGHDGPGHQVRIVDHRNVSDAGQEHPRSAGQGFACSLAVRRGRNESVAS